MQLEKNPICDLEITLVKSQVPCSELSPMRKEVGAGLMGG